MRSMAAQRDTQLQTPASTQLQWSLPWQRVEVLLPDFAQKKLRTNFFRNLACWLRFLKQTTVWSKENRINSADGLKSCTL